MNAGPAWELVIAFSAKVNHRYEETQADAVFGNLPTMQEGDHMNMKSQSYFTLPE